MAERRSGFGAGFSKDVESILGAAQLGHLYPDEVRENLRIAGMELRRQAEMPQFEAYVHPDEAYEEDFADDQEVTDE